MIERLKNVRLRRRESSQSNPEWKQDEYNLTSSQCKIYNLKS